MFPSYAGKLFFQHILCWNQIKYFSIFLFGILPCSFLLIEADGFSFGPRHGLRARLYETFVIFSLLFLLILFFFSLIVSINYFWAREFWNFPKNSMIFLIDKTIITQLIPQWGETKYYCRHDMTSHVTKWPLLSIVHGR